MILTEERFEDGMLKLTSLMVVKTDCGKGTREWVSKSAIFVPLNYKP